MGLFGKKKSQNEGPADPSRREFLKGAAKKSAAVAGGAIALQTLPYLKAMGFGPKDAHALSRLLESDRMRRASPQKVLEYLKNKRYSNEELAEIDWRVKNLGNKLPPGYAHCRDTILAFIYGQKFCGIKAFHTAYSSSYGAEERIVGNRNIRSQEVNEESKILEPAFFLVLNKMGKTLRPGNNYYLGIMEVNPAIGFFERGLDHYFSRWGLGTLHYQFIRSSNDSVETNLIKSLFCAGYETMEIGEQKAQEFLDLNNLAEKQRELEGLMKRFKGMKKDIRSCDPNDGYNRCLAAAWSSFMLVNHYSGTDEYANKMMFFTTIEKPLGLNNFRIRGPPHYYI